MIARTKTVLALPALLLATLLAGLAQAAPPAVLHEVPDDASLVLVVSNLKDLSAKLSKAAVTFNLPVPPDPLGMFTQQFGLAKGLDANGSLAVVGYAPKPGEQGQQPPAVLLIPAADPDALLAGFNPTPPENGISTITVPAAGPTPEFAAVTGKAGDATRFVAVAQDKASLVRYLARTGSLETALTPETLKSMEKNDVSFYVNIPQFSAQAIQGLDAVRPLLLMGMTQRAGRDPKAAAFKQAVVGLYLDGIKRFLTDGSSYMVTMRLNDAGVALGFAGAFKPESPTGKLVTTYKSGKVPALTGLPGGSFLAAGGYAIDPVFMADLGGKIIDSLMSDPALAGNTDVKNYVDLMKQQLALSTGARFVFYPPAAGMDGVFHGVALIDTTDASKYLDTILRMYKNPVLVDMNDQGIKASVDIKENALTVKDVVLNKYTVNFVAKPAKPGEAANPQAAQALAMINMMYGAGGLSIYIGQINKQQVIGVFGEDEKLLQSAIEAAQAGSTALATAPEITAAAGQAIASPSGVFYLPISRWIAVAQAKLSGQPPQEPAAGAPPAEVVVTSFAISGSSGSTEVFVPMSSIMGIAQAAQTLSTLMAPQPPAGGRTGNQHVPPPNF